MEGNSTETFSSIPANDIFVYASLGVMLATTCFVIYMFARILAWASNKPLPSVVQDSAFSMLFVISVMVIAILLLCGVDLIGLFAMAESIVWIVEQYAPVVAAGLGAAFILIVVKWLRAA